MKISASMENSEETKKKRRPRQDWRSLKNFTYQNGLYGNNIICACGKRFWKGSENLVNHREKHAKYDAPLLEKHGIRKSIVKLERLEKSQDREILQSIKVSVQKLAESPYACTICHMKFEEPTDLGKHVETCNKKYSCKHCGKRFRNPGSKNHHENVHTG